MTTTQNYGENLDIVPPTSRTGYRLLGWWTEQIGGTQVGNNTIVNGNATYYAHWQTIAYTISYNMGGHGNAPQGAPTFYTIESETIVPPNPEDEEHHVFNGWSPTSIPHGSTENKTFTQSWQDDFDGASLDMTRWSKGNWEMELTTHSPNNVVVEDGYCKLLMTRVEK